MARRLRLSQILIDLAQDAIPLTPDEDLTAEPAGAAATSNAKSAARLRQRIAARILQPRRRRVRSNIRLGEIIDRTGHAGFGFSFGVLAAMLALLSLPLPGLSWPMGLGICYLGLQMVIGWERPWMPRRARRHRVSMTTLQWISDRLARWTGGMERFIYPRLGLLARGPFFTAVGIALMVHGLGLFLPLPIPGSNLLFILPILMYAIGLLEDDGALILAGHALTALYAVLAVKFWHLIGPVLRDLWVTASAWFGG